MKNLKYNSPPSNEDSIHLEDVFNLDKNAAHNTHLNADSGIVNELKILKSINQTLETNSDIVSLIPGFFEAREIFAEYVRNLSDKYSELKETLIKSCQKVADALRNYGVMTENSEIISFSNIKSSHFRSCNELELIHHSNKIFEKAKLYITTLNYFGISLEDLEKLEIETRKYSYAMGLHSVSIFEKSVWKEEFDRDFDEAYSFVQNTLDGYLEGIKARFPKFYSEYVSAKASAKLNG